MPIKKMSESITVFEISGSLLQHAWWPGPLLAVVVASAALAKAQEEQPPAAPSWELRQEPEVAAPDGGAGPAPGAPPEQPPAPSEAREQQPATEAPVWPQPAPPPLDEPDAPPAGYAERFIDRPLVLPPRLVELQLRGPEVGYFARNRTFSLSMGTSVRVGLLDRWDATLFVDAVVGPVGIALAVTPATGVLLVRRESVQVELEVLVPLTTVLGARTRTTLGLQAGLDTRVRFTGRLALRVGEALLSVTGPELGRAGAPWRFGFRLAPALEVQLARRVALQARVLLVQISAFSELLAAPLVTYGLLPRLVFTAGWRSDVNLDFAVTRSTAGSLTVSGAIAVLWRF